MAKLENVTTGARVEVPSEKVARLGAAWKVVDGSDEASGDPNRPKGNASTEDWAAYAESLGVQYEEGAGRDAIVAAVDAHQAS